MCWNTLQALFFPSGWTRKETKLRGKFSTVRKEHSGTCTDQWWVKLLMLSSSSPLPLSRLFADAIMIILIGSGKVWTFEKKKNKCFHADHTRGIQSIITHCRHGKSFTLPGFNSLAAGMHQALWQKVTNSLKVVSFIRKLYIPDSREIWIA